jgi:hypothetical protein
MCYNMCTCNVDINGLMRSFKDDATGHGDHCPRQRSSSQLVGWMEGISDRAPSCAATVILNVCFLTIKMHMGRKCRGLSSYLSRPISNAFQALQGKKFSKCELSSWSFHMLSENCCFIQLMYIVHNTIVSCNQRGSQLWIYIMLRIQNFECYLTT